MPPAEVSEETGRNGVSAGPCAKKDCDAEAGALRVVRLQKAQSYLHFRRDWGSWSGRTIGQVGITAIFVCQKANWCDLRRMSTGDEAVVRMHQRCGNHGMLEGMSTQLSRTMGQSRSHAPPSQWSRRGRSGSINGSGTAGFFPPSQGNPRAR